MRVTLNPIFGIRNEATCSYVFIINPDYESREKRIPTYTVVPPLYGYILSQFCGEELEETIHKIAASTKINEKIISDFVNRVLNMEVVSDITYFGQKVMFPPTLLKVTDRISQPKIVYGDQFDPFNRFEAKRPAVPIIASIMMTSRCITDCIYCYADRNKRTDFDTERIIQIIEECHKEGVLNMALSGGDIFAHNEWRKIIAKMHECHYIFEISTKMALSPEDISFLKQNGINEIQFSLDSAIPEELEVMVKTQKDYIHKVKEMLQACEDHQVRVMVKTVLTKYNATVSSLSLLYRALEKYKLIYWNIVPAFFSNYKGEFDDYRANNENLLQCRIYLEQLQAKAGFPLQISILEEKTASEPDSYTDVPDFLSKNKGCLVTSYNMSINSFGKVTYCEMLYNKDKFYLGDVYKNSIREIWNSEAMLAFENFQISNLKKNDESPCYSCEKLEKCKGRSAKKVCIVDVLTAYGEEKWDYPDPRCPRAPECDMELILY